MEFQKNFTSSSQSQNQIQKNNSNQYQPLLDQLSSLQEQKQQLFQKLAPFLSLNPIPGLQLPELTCFTSVSTQNNEQDFQQGVVINENNNNTKNDSLVNEEIVNESRIEIFTGENEGKNEDKIEKLSESTNKIKKKTIKKKPIKKNNNKRNRSKKQKQQKQKSNNDPRNNDTDKSDNSLDNFERIHWINQHANIIETMLAESQDKLQLLSRLTQSQQQ